MQFSSIIPLIFLVGSILLISNIKPEQNLLNQYFNEWKIKHNKVYQNSQEQTYRAQIFNNNMQLVNYHNKNYQEGQQSYRISLNYYSDLLPQQFVQTYLNKDQNLNTTQCLGPQAPYKNTFEANFTQAGKGIIINEVSTQGACTAGYAFATIAAVEATMYKYLKNITALSAQQVLDCSTDFNNSGCRGGSPLNSLQYLMAHGNMINSDYKYTANDESCAYNSTKKLWRIDNCTKVESRNISSLKSAILQQPVIVSFQVDPTFSAYKSGYYTSPSNTCGNKINHYMLAVGWGQYITTRSPIKTIHKYLIVKNSFGVAWGQNGYANIQFQADKDSADGPCGILKQSYFPYT